MAHIILLAAYILTLGGPAWGDVKATWECNGEADMREYRTEYSVDGGKTWSPAWTMAHPKPCTSPLTYTDTMVLQPGDYLLRMMAADTSGNVSAPNSPVVPFTIVDTKPPALTGLRAIDVGETNSLVQFDPASGFNADIRIGPEGSWWGQMVSITCEVSGKCPVINLEAGTKYVLRGVRYAGTMNKDAVYGEISEPVVFITTLPVPPPPPSSPPSPPPPSGPSLYDALMNGITTCLDRKLAHTACFKALKDAVGKAKP